MLETSLGLPKAYRIIAIPSPLYGFECWALNERTNERIGEWRIIDLMNILEKSSEYWLWAWTSRIRFLTGAEIFSSPPPRPALCKLLACVECCVLLKGFWFPRTVVSWGPTNCRSCTQSLARGYTSQRYVSLVVFLISVPAHARLMYGCLPYNM
jgi:hypothetical protein